MGAFMKLFTALRGGINEAAEAAADSQGVRIFEQEIRDAEAELRKSEESLTTIIAKQKLSQQKVDALTASIDEHMGYAKQALDKGDEALATEVAEKIAEFQEQQATEEQFLEQFSASSTKLRKSISEAKLNLRRMKQQLDTVKATDSVQKAQTAVASRHLGANSKMKTAAESLERIQQKQSQRQPELEAAQELAAEESGDGLKEKLAAAGIGKTSTSAADILASIKSGNA
jgi:phage shock protein A